jgi:hypothetical protein
MARGWESKDVEAQAEASKEKKWASGHEPKPPEQLLRDQELQGLQLSRTRIANDLESATNPNHRKSLEAALTYLDGKIAALKTS